jgi:hypothetical protein
LHLSLGGGDAVRSEVDEEIRMHLALLTAELMRQGLTEVDARCEAERQFGPVEARRDDLQRLAGRQ